ncbi:hypothetical protein [Streptomyces sp. NPDC048202]|uniref:LppU/SCO3897 family protein n=1 Tax=Streptomyces sp. NPDC048202 TaxID=3365514 RepID=UPI003724A125
MSAPTPPAAPQDPQFPQEQPAYGAAPAPAPAPAKSGKLKKFLGIVAMLIAAVAVKFGIAYAFNSPVHAEAGDCVRVTGSENDPEVDTKDCTDKDANYKVLKVVKDTFDVNACTVGEAALAQEWDAEKFVLCLDPVKK